MDPHFNEYLAAIDGMREVYGERPDEQPTEFHDESAGDAAATPVAPAAAA